MTKRVEALEAELKRVNEQMVEQLARIEGGAVNMQEQLEALQIELRSGAKSRSTASAKQSRAKGKGKRSLKNGEDAAPGEDEPRDESTQESNEDPTKNPRPPTASPDLVLQAGDQSPLTPRIESREMVVCMGAESGQYAKVEDAADDVLDTEVAARRSVDVAPLPPSMYSYLVYRLISGEGTQRNVIDGAVLLLFSLLQQSLVMALCSDIPATLMLNHWDNDAIKDSKSWSCMAAAVDPSEVFFSPGGEKRLWGQPTGLIVAGIFGIALLAVCIQSAEQVMMQTVATPKDISIGVRIVLALVWFWTCLYQIVVLQLIMPMMLASSANQGELVINILASAFIFDVDGMFYNNFLSHDDRDDYEASGLRPQMTEHQASIVCRRIFWCSFAWMASGFLFIRLVVDRHVGQDFVSPYSNCAMVMLCGGAFWRGMSHFLIYFRKGTSAILDILSGIGYGLGSVMAGNLTYVFVFNNMFGFSAPLAGDPYKELATAVGRCFAV